MNEPIQIPQTRERKRFLLPAPAWGRDATGELYIRCACGEVLGMPNHTVSPDGTVSPSLHHHDGGRGCNWHIFGKLVGWDTDPAGAAYKSAEGK